MLGDKNVIRKKEDKALKDEQEDKGRKGTGWGREKGMGSRVGGIRESM